MPSPDQQQPSIVATARRYWREIKSDHGPLAASRAVLASLWSFLRDSTPFRLRQRYGDIDFDWDYRVNTTSGGLGWRERLLGVFHSPYQPTEPALFHQMFDDLQRHTHIDLSQFTLVDLGSGKGRTLLMASDYGFRRILGVELLPMLHQIAQQNIAHYKSHAQKCFAIQSICADATTLPLPDGPLVIFLFNPFPESGFRQVLTNLENSLHANPRAIYVLYHNPQLERNFTAISSLRKIAGTHQYSIFSSVQRNNS
jgi:hypothetical protein